VETRFLVDFMLGRLARWLLLLGYDTVYVSDGRRPDLDAVAQAVREGRVYVTRDTKVPAVSGARKVVLRDQQVERQLKQLFRELELKPDPARFFSRCSACNVPLVGVPRAEAIPKVPEKVRGLDTEFFRCPSCSKLYWRAVVRSWMRPRLDGLVRHPLYSTWAMTYHIETAARKLLAPYLEPDEEAVGAAVAVEHLAPAPVGAEIRVVGTVSRLRGRRLYCHLDVYWKSRKIGRASHLQVVMPRRRFESLVRDA
jgi:uncharacterized protein with PIN domain/predicted thioesterase